MSWSRCGGRVTLQPQLRPRQAIFASIERHRACALSPAPSSTASCTLRHCHSSRYSSGTPRPSLACPGSDGRSQYQPALGSRCGGLLIRSSSLATRSPVHNARRGAYSYCWKRHSSTRARGITIKGPTISDYFSGMGSMSLAAHEVGYNTVYANDNNLHCAETYEKNHCRGGPGISEVDTRAIEEVTSTMHCSSSPPRATILAAGFPCQSYSRLGNQAGLGCKKHGGLLYEVIKSVIHLRNPFVLLENVKSIIEKTHKEAMDMLEEEFDLLGYHVSRHLYRAADFNLPQSRQRVFIVAVRKDVGTSPFIFKEPPGRRGDLALSEILDPPPALVDESQYELQNGVWVPKIVNGRKTEFELDAGRSKALKRVGYIKLKGLNKYETRDAVIHHSGFAGCITTRPSYWYQVPGPAGKEDIIRRLSVQEGRRLQGLPKGFVLPESDHAAWKQLGNTVPPPMVKWILQCMREQYPDILSPETYSTVEVWPHVQAPKRSRKEASNIKQQLDMLELRKKSREERREAQKALKKEAERAAGAGKAPETKTKNSIKTDEEEILAALEEKLRI